MNSSPGIIGRTYRHINRYREIVTVLLKHGFGDFVTQTHVDKYIRLSRKLFSNRNDAKKQLSRWERVRIVCEELGPTFIKFGQVMSNRPDLLPPDLISELEKLQDKVPPFPSRLAKEIIEEELGRPIPSLFRKFTEKPMASASIAQIHQAILFSGEEVVLKVRRPEIEQIVEVDLEIMFHLAAMMEKHLEGAENFNPHGIIEEFEKAIRKEMNFTQESTNIERFSFNFQEDKAIYVPKVYHPYTTRKVLVMEQVVGTKVSEIQTLKDSGIDPKDVADRIVNLVLTQVFDHGFFHGDPHPGNINVLEDNVICFLDFGLMGTVLPRHREFLGSVIIGIINKDAKVITRALLELSTNKDIGNTRELESRIFEFVQQYAYLPLKDIHMGELLNNMIQMVISFHLGLPPDIYLLSKAIITVESIADKLNPELNIINLMEPYAHQLLRERLSPKKLAKDIYLSSAEFSHLLRDLPSDIREIIERFKYGNINLGFEHKGLQPMLKKHDQISNRVSFAIVLAALIVGSSLFVHAGIPPKWKGMPIIGLIGFLGAGIMGFWLLISILRHGKM